MPISPLGPLEPRKTIPTAAPVVKPVPASSEKIEAIMKKGNVFKEANTDTVQSPFSKVSVSVLKDYTDKDFIDDINAFKHLPIVDIALKQISQNFSRRESSNDPVKLEETLTNQFKNLEVLIDILTDILPEAGDKINQLREPDDLRPYLAGEEPIDDETAFKIRDEFQSQLKK